MSTKHTTRRAPHMDPFVVVERHKFEGRRAFWTVDLKVKNQSFRVARDFPKADAIFMRDMLEQSTDVERALHRVASAGHLSYEQRSRLAGRVRYLMVQADMRKRDIDIEKVIAAEVRRETR